MKKKKERKRQLTWEVCEMLLLSRAGIGKLVLPLLLPLEEEMHMSGLCLFLDGGPRCCTALLLLLAQGRKEWTPPCSWCCYCRRGEEGGRSECSTVRVLRVGGMPDMVVALGMDVMLTVRYASCEE